MSDRTFQQQVAEILAEYGNDDAHEDAVLGIDNVYYIEEGPVGTVDETAASLSTLSREILAAA